MESIRILVIQATELLNTDWVETEPEAPFVYWKTAVRSYIRPFHGCDVNGCSPLEDAITTTGIRDADWLARQASLA